MISKRSAPELTTIALPSPTRTTFVKALKSPIKMLPSLNSPTKPKTALAPSHLPHETFINEDPITPPGLVPTLNIQRASGSTQDPFLDDAPATWTCCRCGTHNPVSIHPGAHPVGALACICPHKPCSACKTAGQVKPFQPMDEPAMVPCGPASPGTAIPPGDDTAKEKRTELRFGIVCPACGLSWRAREFGKRWSKTLRKMPSVSLGRNAHLAPPALRKSRSTLVLGSKRIITPPGAAGLKQAEYVAVRFSGVSCTCGTTVTLKAALCFQIVGAQMDENESEGEGEGTWVWKGSLVGWTTTAEFKEKGHGTPVLRILGVEHPNPLKSAPVVDELARNSWEKKCDRKGWV
jgi:hypothetical protein